MPNISIYLNDEQKKKLDILQEKGVDCSEPENLSTSEIVPKRTRSVMIGMWIDRAYQKLEEADMIADAVAIDNENLGWNEEEELCQALDLEKSGR